MLHFEKIMPKNDPSLFHTCYVLEREKRHVHDTRWLTQGECLINMRVQIDHVSSAGAYQRIVPVFGNFCSNFSVVQQEPATAIPSATRSRASICCEHQISLGNLTNDSAFDRGTLLFK